MAFIEGKPTTLNKPEDIEWVPNKNLGYNEKKSVSMEIKRVRRMAIRCFRKRESESRKVEEEPSVSYIERIALCHTCSTFISACKSYRF